MDRYKKLNQKYLLQKYIESMKSERTAMHMIFDTKLYDGNLWISLFYWNTILWS